MCVSIVLCNTYRSVMLARIWSNANISRCCLAVANQSSNMLFYLELLPKVPLDSCQLLINQEVLKLYQFDRFPTFIRLEHSSPP